MANTPHTIFQNTLRDLQDCYFALLKGEALSTDEKQALSELITLCGDMYCAYGSDEEEPSDPSLV